MNDFINSIVGYSHLFIVWVFYKHYSVTAWLKSWVSRVLISCNKKKGGKSCQSLSKLQGAWFFLSKVSGWSLVNGKKKKVVGEFCPLKWVHPTRLRFVRIQYDFRIFEITQCGWDMDPVDEKWIQCSSVATGNISHRLFFVVMQNVIKKIYITSFNHWIKKLYYLQLFFTIFFLNAEDLIPLLDVPSIIC